MHFLIALFLGIYIFGRMIYEGEKKDKQERETKEHLEYCDKKTKLLKPPIEMCWEMNDMVDSGKHVDEIYNKLDNELTAVFGDDYKKDFPIAGSEFYNYNEHYINDIWTKDLLYSQLGLCDKFHLSFHLGYGKRAIVDLKLCQQIEHNLRKYSKLPQITFVQKPQRKLSNGEYEWAIFGSTIIPQDMLWPNEPYKRLWNGNKLNYTI